VFRRWFFSASHLPQVTCRAFSIPAPSLGFSPSESVLAVSRTPLGSPCPSFRWSVRIHSVVVAFDGAIAPDADLHAPAETSSAFASTASLAASGSAPFSPPLLAVAAAWGAGEVTPASPAQVEKRWLWRPWHCCPDTAARPLARGLDPSRSGFRLDEAKTCVFTEHWLSPRLSGSVDCT